MAQNATKTFDATRYWNDRFDRFGHTGYKRPEIYDYDQGLRLLAVDKALRQVGFEVGPDTHVLELGCGVGDFVAHFAAKGARVHGVDISSKTVENTRKRFSSTPAVTLEVASLQEFSFPKEQYDLILSITVLQHLGSDREVESVMKRIESSLKPGGLFLAVETTQPITSGQVTEDYLQPRAETKWRSMFRQGALTPIRESAHAQMGLTLMRWGLGLVRQLRGGSKADSESAGNSPSRVLSTALKMFRPIDAMISAVIPVQLFATRLYVLKKRA